MIIPEYIQKGDKIGIVSTASKIDKEVVEPAIDLLLNLGFKVELGEYIYSENHQFAGTDRQRSSDLQQMLDNQDIKAIICSRGGYGTFRTLQNISWDKFLKNPKWIVGFSDITVLHSKLNASRIASIHGVMPKFFIENNEPTKSFNTLLNALIGQKNEYQIQASKYNRRGNATAEVVGGNLSILYSLRGTPFDIDTDGKILFIEDLAEYLYHIDRIMMNLKTGGKLSKLKGLIVGSFTGMKDNETPFGKTIEEVIFDAVKEFDFPVIFDFPAGHQTTNYALKMGGNITIEANKKEVTVYQL